MIRSKRKWVVLGLIALAIIIGMDYHNEINKVDERVIRGVAEYTLIIESIRVDESFYELKDKMKRAEELNALIPVNEISKREVEYILIVKGLNELLYDISYAQRNGEEQDLLEAKNRYDEYLEKIHVILLLYRDKYSEVEELWSQGVFTD